ncbi:MAG: LolA family protein [Bacteroidota bacterium]
MTGLLVWAVFAFIAMPSAFACPTAAAKAGAMPTAAHAGGTVNATEIETGLDRVRTQFKEGKVLHAQITHELTDAYTGETQVVEGRLWISREKYKIIADHQSILVDGETSMVYNQLQNKLIISEYEPEEDDFAPSRFFSEGDDLFQVVDITDEGEATCFLLRPDDPFELFTEVSIYLKDDLTPIRIDATDQMDNTLSTRFTDAWYMEDAESVFVLDYPDDAEIIDLRK